MTGIDQCLADWPQQRVVAAPAVDRLKACKVDEVIARIKRRAWGQVCLLTHPNRWASSPLEWMLEYILDAALNRIKTLLLSFRR